jgi:SAM-dependent methyltransferase
MDAFDEMYRSGRPPWDVGRPQPAFVELEAAGAIGRRVLDAGCGTGELALFLGSRGHEAWGIDGAPTAIAMAQRKARERTVKATFRVHDALALETLGGTFDTVTDCGLFHVFDDADRPRYERSMRSAVRPGGNLAILCFSEEEPGDWGPRRVTQKELRATFARGWRVESITPNRFETNLEASAKAWLARFRRA